MTEELLTAEDLAARWKVSQSKVYQMLRRNEGPQPIRIGRQMRFKMADVIYFEAQSREGK